MFDLPEAMARWERVRQMMTAQDLDMVIAIDFSRDEILLGHQRWLTGFIPIGGPAAAILHRGGEVELITERIGKEVPKYYAARGFPIDLVEGFSVALIAERITRRRPARIGIVESASFPLALEMALGRSAPELVDVSKDFLNLRLIKSSYEITLIRKSCAIADAVWTRVPEIFKIGRKNYEIIADIDHLVRLEGAENGFHLMLPMPFLGRAMHSLANGDRIEANARYLMEVSPRYRGYYSQLTVPVTSHPHDEPGMCAYDDLVAAKQAAQPLMRPGTDLSEVAKSIESFLAERNHSMTSRSLGHFCGMALEEPRHDPKSPFILQAGMTLIFHPILATPDFRSMMRADTYLITEKGAERLNRYDGRMLNIS